MNELPIATRRSFLAHGLGLIGIGTVLPNFLIRTALAGPQTPDQDPRILVLLEMNGGHDGPSALVPYALDGYHRLRKTTRIPTAEVIWLNDELGLHPNLKGFRALLDQRGAFAAIPGVGYPNPNYSRAASHHGGMSPRPWVAPLRAEPFPASARGEPSTYNRLEADFEGRKQHGQS
jgi:uncharacterized protein (DUF1501 family)